MPLETVMRNRDPLKLKPNPQIIFYPDSIALKYLSPDNHKL
jgi:hypothetical protein